MLWSVLPACLTVICLADVQNQLLRSFTMRNYPPRCLVQESYEVTNDTRINQLLRSCAIKNRRQHYCGQEYCENTKKRLKENTKRPRFINCSDCLH